MKLILLSASILFSSLLVAQEPNIIPKPAVMTVLTGTFSLNTNTVLVINNQADQTIVDLFNEYLKNYYGFTLKQSPARPQKNFISFVTVQTILPGEEGAYAISVSGDNISVDGQTASGSFYGMQTLIQLLPVNNLSKTFTIPSVNINDKPRFAYRGMHLDVGRHFFPVSFIKKYIDFLALHKMNYFHWHLTEDQGWRIEIKKYPELTKTGAWRNGTIIGRYPGKGSDNKPYGGFYTQEEVKEVVAYASKRFITVVPEIEMPGHSGAAIASYSYLSCFPDEPTKIPANMISKQSIAQQKAGRKKLVQETWGVFDDVFCAGKESTFQFLQDVMDEVLALFPSKYIHVGGDECPKTNWKRCPLCQKRIKDEGLKNEHELQSYFIQRMEKYLNSKGRTLIGWDEILEGGLAPNAVVMSWRGEEGGIAAAKEKHDVIMTPGGWCYLDHSQSQNEDSVTIGGYTPVDKVYNYEPIPADLNNEQGKYIKGAQGNVWTEYMGNTRKVEYMIFPRMSALSEVLWSPKESRDWKEFETRLKQQFKRYDLWKTNYSTEYFSLSSAVIPNAGYSGVQWQLESRDPSVSIVYNKDVGKKLLKYTTPIPVSANSMLFAYPSGRPASKVRVHIHFNLATGKKISLANPPSPNYPGNGAFTLVDGVINDMGFARTREFLGFNGTDCEAVIDLGKSQPIRSVIVNALTQEPSWIYQPASAETLASDDGNNFRSLAKTTEFKQTVNGKGVLTMNFPRTSTRYVKLVIKNWGVIAEGHEGAGNKAWLFLDEIEVR
jgi:hexosaminidase